MWTPYPIHLRTTCDNTWGITHWLQNWAAISLNFLSFLASTSALVLSHIALHYRAKPSITTTIVIGIVITFFVKNRLATGTQEGWGNRRRKGKTNSGLQTHFVSILVDSTGLRGTVPTRAAGVLHLWWGWLHKIIQPELQEYSISGGDDYTKSSNPSCRSTPSLVGMITQNHPTRAAGVLHLWWGWLHKIIQPELQEYSISGGDDYTKSSNPSSRSTPSLVGMITQNHPTRAAGVLHLWWGWLHKIIQPEQQEYSISGGDDYTKSSNPSCRSAPSLVGMIKQNHPTRAAGVLHLWWGWLHKIIQPEQQEYSISGGDDYSKSEVDKSRSPGCHGH